MEARRNMSAFASFLSSLSIAFLIGSIPTAFIYVKLKTGEDIRSLGSGNVGATNVMRVVGKKHGIFVLFADALKGIVSVLLLSFYFSVDHNALSPKTYQFLIGLSSILGHVFTPFLCFKGGKGVAVSAGVGISIYPFQFLTALFS